MKLLIFLGDPGFELPTQKLSKQNHVHQVSEYDARFHGHGYFNQCKNMHVSRVSYLGAGKIAHYLKII